MTAPSQDDLVAAIAAATRLAVTRLFREHAERFYYISLITYGSATPPSLSAWSIEALDRAVLSDPEPEKARFVLKWSYADSPYVNWCDEYFEDVRRLFAMRPEMSHLMTRTEWQAEYDLRLDAMEMALRRLDEDGLFGTGPSRSEIVVNAEVMPPDYTNTQRARRLNPPEAIATWLAEAAEEEPAVLAFEPSARH